MMHAHLYTVQLIYSTTLLPTYKIILPFTNGKENHIIKENLLFLSYLQILAYLSFPLS